MEGVYGFHLSMVQESLEAQWMRCTDGPRCQTCVAADAYPALFRSVGVDSCRTSSFPCYFDTPCSTACSLYQHAACFTLNNSTVWCSLKNSYTSNTLSSAILLRWNHEPFIVNAQTGEFFALRKQQGWFAPLIGLLNLIGVVRHCLEQVQIVLYII